MQWSSRARLFIAARNLTVAVISTEHLRHLTRRFLLSLALQEAPTPRQLCTAAVDSSAVPRAAHLHPLDGELVVRDVCLVENQDERQLRLVQDAAGLPDGARIHRVSHAGATGGPLLAFQISITRYGTRRIEALPIADSLNAHLEL